MKIENPGLKLALAAACGVIGGTIGHFLFLWIIRQGFEALVLPGALVGIGAGIIMKERSVPLMIVCGLVGLFAGLLSEWRAFPFIKDEGFAYFLSHIQDLRPITLLMLALGTFAGAYFARGRVAPLETRQ
jgi:ABC-type amino acid transport system permease subunit